VADADRVLLARDGGVAELVLNRPDKRNAIDDRLVRELDRALDAAESDRTVRVLLLRGEGPAFCAGADLEQLERLAAGLSAMENLADAMALGDIFIRMRRSSKPIIAAVHGQAFAGGAGLATACDLVLASDDAQFAYPEVRLGFVPAMVMAILRRAVGEKVAFELVTRGEPIDAAQAHRIGLVNRVLPAASFLDDARSYAAGLAERPASAVALTKRLLYGMDGLSFEEAIARGAEVNVIARSTPECREGVRRFLESRRKR
jgi:methylglutaconyl-CoA hydratase